MKMSDEKQDDVKKEEAATEAQAKERASDALPETEVVEEVYGGGIARPIVRLQWTLLTLETTHSGATWSCISVPMKICCRNTSGT